MTHALTRLRFSERAPQLQTSRRCRDPDRALAQSEWISRQVQAMASAWSRGQPVSAEDLLAPHPGLDDEAAIRLIYEEVCLRRESGEDVATTEIVNRFPRWKDELEVLLGCDRMLRPFSRAAMFPPVGEDLGPFRLLAELGRGASGKTYLAAEPGLGNRLVVLKVITDDQEEHLSLARLRHTHIIPLFSEQSFPQRGLRALCMPYLAGASLARILDGLALIPPEARRGRHLLDILDRMQASGAHRPVDHRRPLPPLPRPGVLRPGCLLDRRVPGRRLAWRACSWPGPHGREAIERLDRRRWAASCCLISISHTGRSARANASSTDWEERPAGWHPSTARRWRPSGQGQAVAVPVDGRADIYALGLLLREALAEPRAARGRGPGESWSTPRAEVSVGLADIVARCLATDPAHRYHDAAQVADDLRRHLSDLPLCGVANRSVVERWRKWRRRQPAALTRWSATLIACAALVAVLFLAYAFHRQRVRAD